MSFEQTQEFLAPAVQFAFNSIGAGAVAGRSVELLNQFNDVNSVTPDLGVHAKNTFGGYNHS